ncbi:hypothetical protein [Pseudomonas aeruginosa]|uniref:hypothetical protein n=1 Tax=Pseudomonas aeruginosa TaxID=287 RepID=UPI0004736C66|nr:hypothetical protein [Pseudomonas aeruginosa]
MSHRIRCKMICHGVTRNEHGDPNDPKSIVSFGAVWSPDTGKPHDENAIYGKATPWGEYKAAWDSAVADKLEVGKAYYVDFTPAD